MLLHRKISLLLAAKLIKTLFRGNPPPFSPLSHQQEHQATSLTSPEDDGFGHPALFVKLIPAVITRF